MIVRLIAMDEHPSLEAAAFCTAFPRSLGEIPSPQGVLHYFGLDAHAPLRTDEDVQAAIRDLLRVGGFRPTGRSKPSSEYLRKAALEGRLTSINAAVDAGNAVSLHSGLPVSVVDADRARPPWRIGLAAPGSSYVFNPSGQVIDVGDLLCLHDAEGPCASPVKDSQRTKTHDGSTRTLSVVWGTRCLAGRTDEALRWYLALLREMGAATEGVLP
jgi:DNA/RNA-binding domain of Phe-tRNA-synthetase-like protein